MSLLDTIGKTITETGRMAKQRTKDLTESAKIRAARVENLEQLEELYQEIGEKYVIYEGKLEKEDHEALMAKAAELREKEREYASLLETLNPPAKIECRYCGHMVEKGAAFCSSCGKRLAEEEPEEEQEEKQEEEQKVDQGEVQKEEQAKVQEAEKKGEEKVKQKEKQEGQQKIEQTKEHKKKDTDGHDHIVLSRKCPACGTQLPADVIFCINCGRKMEVEVQIEAAKQKETEGTNAGSIEEKAEQAKTKNRSQDSETVDSSNSEHSDGFVEEAELERDEKCPACGRPLVPGMCFCMYCGNALGLSWALKKRLPVLRTMKSAIEMEEYLLHNFQDQLSEDQVKEIEEWSSVERMYGGDMSQKLLNSVIRWIDQGEEQT